MSEKHDAMWGADAGEYIAEQEAEIDRLRAALDEIRRKDWRFANDGTTKIYGRCSNIARKVLAKEGK